MPRPSLASPRESMMVRTLSPMEPRWTGICGALAMSAPSRSNSAQEKSRRSLMFTEEAVFCSARPISSATAMKRLLNTSSMIGFTSVLADPRRGSVARSRIKLPRESSDARQPGSTTVHAFIADLRHGGGFDALKRNALGEKGVARLSGESINGLTERGQRSLQRLVYRPFTDGCHVGNADPIGRQDAGEGVNHHAADAE